MATITGTNGNDNGISAPELIGTKNADTINGLDGQDVIEGLGGADIIDGGNGTDRVTYRNSEGGVVINLATGIGSGGFNSSFPFYKIDGTRFTSIEEVEGSAFADTLTGDAGVNGLGGRGGKDILEGGAGADIIDGGSDSDTTSYSGSSAGVTVNLATFSGVGGDAEGDQIYNTENITGSAHADLLTGDGNANILDGGAGNDTLTGAGGNDILRGGAGDDTAVFSGTRANATFTQSGTAITVISADGTDTLEAVEFLKFSDQTVSAESLFPSTSTTIRVTTFADVVDANDGVTSLREAVTLANAAGKQMTIELDAGLYGLTADRGLDIIGNVIMHGAGMDQTAIINIGPRDSGYSALHVNKGAVFDLSNLNIYGGANSIGGANSSGVPSNKLNNGGVLLNEGGNVTINNTSFDYSALGQATQNSTLIDKPHTAVVGIGTPFGTIMNFKFDLSVNFSASQGGAIFNTDGGIMEIVGSAFSNNSASRGGALAADSGYVSVDTTVFDSNNVYGYTGQPSPTTKGDVGGTGGFSGGAGLGAAIYSTGSARIDVYSNKASTGTPTTFINNGVTDRKTNLPIFPDAGLNGIPDVTLVYGPVYLDPTILVRGNTAQDLYGVTFTTPYGSPVASATSESSLARNVEASAAAFEFGASSAAGVPALLTLLSGLDLSLANPDLALVVNSILSQSDGEITIQLAGNRIVLSGTGLAFTGDPIALTEAELILAATGTIASITIQNKDGTATVGSLTGISASFKDVLTDLTTVNTDGSSKTLADAFKTSITQNGSAEVDALFGSEKKDVINALASDDQVTGKGGNDILNGGAGVDTAIYSGNQTSYTLTLTSTGSMLTDRRADGDGTDTLYSVEMLAFMDRTIDMNDFSSVTQLNNDQFKSLAEMYVAYFNRAPDAEGLFYWADKLAEGLTMDQIAELFFDQDETRAIYTDPSNTDAFVTAVYANVLGRTPDVDGFSFWKGKLAEGEVTQGSLVLNTIVGAKNGGGPNDAAYLSDKTDLGIYYSAIKGLSDSTDGRQVMAAFGDQATANKLGAKTAIDSHYADATSDTNGDFLFNVVGVVDNPFIDFV